MARDALFAFLVGMLGAKVRLAGGRPALAKAYLRGDALALD